MLDNDHLAMIFPVALWLIISLAVVSRADDAYPCSNTTILACLSCYQDDILSQEDCVARGDFVTCYGENPETYACYQKTTMSPQGDIISYQHGCIEASKCCGNMWSGNGECSKAGMCGDAVFTCERCYYGCPNTTRNCTNINPVAAYIFIPQNNGKDLTGGGNNFNMAGIEYTNGSQGEEMGAAILPQQPGQSMVVVEPNERLHFDDQMTIFMRLRPEDIENPAALLTYYQGGDASIPLGFYLYFYQESLWMDDGIGTPIQVADIIKVNTWTDIALVVSPQDITFYVDGTEALYSTWTVNLGYTATGDLYLGMPPAATVFRGSIECLKLFDLPLVSGDVQLLTCDF